MAFFVLLFLIFFPFQGLSAFSFDTNAPAVIERAEQTFLSESNSVPEGISDRMSQIFTPLETASLTGFTEETWDRIKIKAKEEAGIDVSRLGAWIAGILSKLFLWISGFFGRFAR